MQIVYKQVAELIPYVNNARKNDQAVDAVASSIKNYGFKQPIVIDSQGEVIAGHTRLKASQKLGLDEVPCIVADDLTPAQVKAYRIADNKVAELSEWDYELLKLELEDIEGFTGFEIIENLENNQSINEYEPKKMTDKFLVPPFSVLDTKQDYWQKRKNYWLNLGIKSESGRETGTYKTDQLQKGKDTMSETSIFDPLLCEVIYKWFNVENGKILDVFAGGSVRGIVASKLGFQYFGNDLRTEQILANIENAKNVLNDNELFPNWSIGDSLEIKKIINDRNFDLFFSCPPYADLEVYSNLENDLSNMEYNNFIEVYKKIIKEGTEMLAENRFAVFVVGEVRDKKGNYYNFVSDTIQAFLDAGLKYYNEMILVNMIGTLPMRAGKIFNNSRKIGKQHQNILVFYKGNTKNIKDFFPLLEISAIQDQSGDLNG